MGQFLRYFTSKSVLTVGISNILQRGLCWFRRGFDIPGLCLQNLSLRNPAKIDTCTMYWFNFWDNIMLFLASTKYTVLDWSQYAALKIVTFVFRGLCENWLCLFGAFYGEMLCLLRLVLRGKDCAYLVFELCEKWLGLFDGFYRETYIVLIFCVVKERLCLFSLWVYERMVVLIDR